MAKCEVIIRNKRPATNCTVLLDGADVTNDVYKVEINVLDMLLFMYEKPRTANADHQLNSKVVTIDELSVATELEKSATA